MNSRLFIKQLSYQQIRHHVNAIFTPDNLLNEKNLEKTMTKFNKLSVGRTTSNTPTRDAAVLIPLCVIDGQVSLLYTLRSTNLKSHRSQVSFPGGMRDHQDTSYTATALRETEEEIGLAPHRFRVWGEGQSMRSRGDVAIQPVVATVQGTLQLNELQLNPNEVEDIFSVTIERLCDPKLMRHTQYRNNYTLPVYLGGKRKIWGITAMITYMFLRALLPADVYKHRLTFIPSITR